MKEKVTENGQLIRCPYCFKEFPVGDAISRQIKEKLDREYREKMEKIEREAARKIDSEGKRIREEILRKAGEDSRLRERDHELLISGLRSQIDDMKRKAEQGSQERQGEALETEIEQALRAAFPGDEISPVKKGARGGDILQKVRDQSGRECGAILWEAKRAMSWGGGWTAKLKDDMRRAQAGIGVIVSTVLPKEVTHFGSYEGVWVAEFPLAAGLAAALRSGLEKEARALATQDGKHGKMEHLYGYLTGSEFRQHVEGIMESFISLKEQLDSEKRAMNLIWKKREKNLERVMLNMSGMYGSLQEIVGKSLPAIKAMELKELSSGE